MRAMLRSATIVFAGLFGASVATSAQSPAARTEPPPTAFILGRTMDGGTGQPLGGVVVTLTYTPVGRDTGTPAPPQALGRFPERIISDGEGRFVFHSLAAGRYDISVSKDGYVTSAVGRTSAADTGSQMLRLADGERRGDVSVSLWKYAAIGGTIVDEVGDPVVGIQISVLKRAIVGGRPTFINTGGTVATDDRGMYEISNLLPGDYIVGIVTTQSTVPASLMQAFTATAAAGSSADLQRELSRSGGGIQALMGGGQRVGSWFLSAPRSVAAQSDMQAPPVGDGRVQVYPTTFYGGTGVPSNATPVRVGSGEERLGVDLQVRPVPTATVSGVLMGPDGPEPQTTLQLFGDSIGDVQAEAQFAVASTVSDGAGHFLFLGVPLGSYTIQSFKTPPRPPATSVATTVIQTGNNTIMSMGPSRPPPIPPDPTLTATVPVVVDKDVTGVVITFHPGARLSGRVEFRGTAPVPDADKLASMNLTVSPADGKSAPSVPFQLTRGAVDESGQFKTFQFPAGRYVIRAVGAFPGWWFEGATLGGQDVTDAPLELGTEDIGNIVVVFSDQHNALSGTARNAAGPDPDATVLVFPAQRERWIDYGPTPRRLRTARVDSSGMYDVTDLPPGDYLVAAIDGDVTLDWRDPAFLEPLAARATRVTIVDGDRKSLDVEVMR